MEESLEDRLKSHAQAFDGLLSLIPAKFYYEDDKDEQWPRKKQTKDQAKAAKLAKLDPDNARSARDVLDERAARSSGAGKRKRDEDGSDDDILNGDSQDDQLHGIHQEKPMEGLKRKKAKTDSESAAAVFAGEVAVTQTSKAEAKAIQAKEKADRKRLKAGRRKDKMKEKAQEKQAKAEAKRSGASKQNRQIDEQQEDGRDEDKEVADFIGEDLADSIPESPPSKPPSPSFDVPSSVSGTSSISSIATQNALNTNNLTKKNPPQQPPSSTQEELRARLQARILELRQARRADGDADRPARSRTELIEQRRKKAEQKKATKKALRAQAEDEERRKRNEALAKGSPLMTPRGNMSPAQVASPSSDSPNFSFSRVAFDNGQIMSANLTSVLNPRKQGTTTKVSKDNLDALEKRQDRLSEMTPEQRAVAEEKDMWSTAKNRAQGFRVKDDTSLLKRALKRKDNKKKKSSKDWNDRLAGVASAQAAKQKRREDNLNKRKEEKSNSRSGGKGKKSSSKGKKKVKSRPGFEGSFKASAKSKQK